MLAGSADRDGGNISMRDMGAMWGMALCGGGIKWGYDKISEPVVLAGPRQDPQAGARGRSGHQQAVQVAHGKSRSGLLYSSWNPK